VNTIRFSDERVKVIAHRGLSGLECENTCAAFVAAGNRSYYGVETDIHVTTDGEFVVFHDDNLKRMTGFDLNIENCDLKQIRSLRLRDRDGLVREDLCIPTLQEYVRICRKYDKKCVLELKNHFDQHNIISVVEIIRKMEWLENTIFISFDLENLLTIRELLPQQKAQYLVESISDEILETIGQYRLDVDAAHYVLTPEFITAVHACGCEVNAWTVDCLVDAARLAKMDVDYITTNIIE